MTVLFDRVLRSRCPNSVHTLEPPQYPDGWPETVSLGGEQIRAAIWAFGGNITLAARHLRVDPARLRRFVNEIDKSLLEDIVRINNILADYALGIIDGGDASGQPRGRAARARRAPQLCT